MRTHLVSIVVILTVSTAAAGPARQEPPAAAASDLKPVTVAVVDRDSGAPVTAFTYQASYDAPGRKSPAKGDVWTPVASPAGTFEIQTPPACRLHVMAKAPDYIGGYPMVNEFDIKSTDQPRRVVVRLRRGITVRGTVRDARTRDPIAGAIVAPVIHVLPVWVPDEDKRVKTGPDGRYEVRGVDPALGVSTSHPNYIRDPVFPEGKTTGPNHDVFLNRGVAIAAIVVDSNGQPLEGAMARDFQDRRAISGKGGKLVFQNPNLILGLTFHKAGFIDRKLEAEEIHRELAKPEGLVVVMEPTIAVTGRVVAPDGRPVAAFHIFAGPGKLSKASDSVGYSVRDPDGRFLLNLSKTGTNWVGVLADGFAAWEGWVDVKRGGAPMEVRLSPGVAVSARVAVPEALRSRIRARLVPRRDKTEIGGIPSNPPAELIAIRAATLSADGTLRFERVRPDRYRLFLEAHGIRTTVLALDVPDAGLDMGVVRVDVPTATGRIEGRVWHPKAKGGGVWAFAKGYVGGYRYEGRGDDNVPSIEFQADEHGHFQVDHVPVGLSTLGFPFQVFDVVNTYTWSVHVAEGQTTEVRAFDPEARQAFTLAFAIGDGSTAQYLSGTGLGASRKVDNVTVDSRMIASALKRPVSWREPMFRVDLVPDSRNPLWFAQPDWEKLDVRKVVLPDVGPGKYRLRVYDWLGLVGLNGGPLFDQDVVVPPGDRGEVRIALGAGCITGKIPALKDNFERPVEVTAVPKENHTLPRRARCDDDGNFCVRYLSPGTYSLFIHDPNAGFCRLDDVKVPAGVVDVGERMISAGATIRGAIHFARPSRVPDEVVAVGPSGASVRRAFLVYSSFDQVDLAGLWPGHWTVSARSGDEILATGEVDVKGTGTFPVTLTVGGGRKP